MNHGDERNSLVPHLPLYDHLGKITISSPIFGRGIARTSETVGRRGPRTREKPYACTLCEYKANTSCRVTKHMLTHTGVKPFACLECDYKAAQKASLIVHMRTHSNEKPFGCDYCPYRSAASGSVTRHMKRCRERPSTSEQ